MRRLLWYGNSSGSDRNPNSSDNPVCLSVQSYGTYCQHILLKDGVNILYPSPKDHGIPGRYIVISAVLVKFWLLNETY
jgi:hypothetical protein